MNSMKRAMLQAQGAVAEQLLEGAMPVIASAVDFMRDRAAKVAIVAGLSVAASFGAGAQTQIGDAGQRIGEAVGQAVGKNQNLGQEAGRILGVTLNTVGKAIAGEQINGRDVAGTIGQVGGGIIGYKIAGGGNASPLGKVVGVTIGATGGAILGQAVGGMYDQNKANEMSAPIALGPADQNAFVEGMRRAAQQRQNVAFTPESANGGSARPIAPQQAGITGFMAKTVQQTRLQMLSSGKMQMPDQVMAALATRAMEVVKVGEQYGAATEMWDSAFLTGRPTGVKVQINNHLVDTNDLLKRKTFEYLQARNAVAAQGYDVSLMDGAISNRLAGLKDQTNMGFKVAARGTQLTGGALR